MKAKKNSLEDFPFESKLSFSNIIGYWELRAQEKGTFADPVAKDILAKLKATPELHYPIEDLGIIEKNKPLIQWLLSAVLPPALIHDQLIAIVPPFKMEFVYTTKSFENLMKEIGGDSIHRGITSIGGKMQPLEELNNVIATNLAILSYKEPV